MTKGQLRKDWGDELKHALHFFMGLRLKAGLKELEMGKPVSGEADPKSMSSLDRDLLKDSLGVVKRFKATLRQRFRLDVI